MSGNRIVGMIFLPNENRAANAAPGINHLVVAMNVGLSFATRLPRTTDAMTMLFHLSGRLQMNLQVVMLGITHPLVRETRILRAVDEIYSSSQHLLASRLIPIMAG